MSISVKTSFKAAEPARIFKLRPNFPRRASIAASLSDWNSSGLISSSESAKQYLKTKNKKKNMVFLWIFSK
jgi:hypothetical protein